MVARRAHNPEVVRFKSHPRNQKQFHSRYNFGYGILLFSPKTTIFDGFLGRFSFINDKSATLCPDKARMADVLSFKECNRSHN